MDQKQKQAEMNHILKNMIRQKEQERETQKRLSQEEYQITQDAMYLPAGLDLY